MKRIAYAALALVLCLSLFACKADKKDSNKNADTTAPAETTKKLVEKVYNDDGGYTTFDYNEDGNITLSTTYDIEGNLLHSTETVYDENGNALKKIWYDASGEIIREMEI